MRVFSILIVFFVIMILLTFCSIVPARNGTSWNVQTVDESGAGFGVGYCPIVIDTKNNPHIAFTGYTLPYQFNVVRYASWNGLGWITQTIDGGIAYSLVLNSNNDPHLLYNSGDGLMYASYKGTNWTRQTIDANGADFGDVELDSVGTPHVVYTDGKAIKYASWTGSNWHIQTVENASENGGLYLGVGSLAMDQNDTPYILYQSQYVKLATYRNSTWNIQTVDFSLDGFGNLILDSKGHPNFIYKMNYGFNNNTLIYAHWNGYSWNTQTVVSNAGLFFNSVGSLVLDSDDFPHIAYITSSSELMYTSWTGRAWNIQTVDTNSSISAPCYLTADSNGNPHISFLVLVGFGYSDNHSIIMYTSAREPTETSSSSFLNFSSGLVLIVVIVGLVVTVAYIWKKKTWS